MCEYQIELVSIYRAEQREVIFCVHFKLHDDYIYDSTVVVGRWGVCNIFLCFSFCSGGPSSFSSFVLSQLGVWNVLNFFFSAVGSHLYQTVVIGSDKFVCQY